MKNLSARVSDESYDKVKDYKEKKNFKNMDETLDAFIQNAQFKEE